MVAWWNPADIKMEGASAVLEDNFKDGNVRSLAVARGGGDLKRFSVAKIEFPAHSARSKMNSFITQTSVACGRGKMSTCLRDDATAAANHVEIATHIY